MLSLYEVHELNT